MSVEIFIEYVQLQSDMFVCNIPVKRPLRGLGGIGQIRKLYKSAPSFRRSLSNPFHGWNNPLSALRDLGTAWACNYQVLLIFTP